MWATHWVAVGRRRMRAAGLGNCASARQCLAPTLCPNVGATHWVALGRSCRRARSCSEQTNREAGLGNCGRRGASPDEGEARRGYIVSQRRGAGSRARQCLAALVRARNKQIATLCPAGRRRRGDPLGRPYIVVVHAVHAEALVRARNKQIARRAWEIVGGAGRRRMRARQCLAPTFVSQRRGDPLGRPGRSCRRARSCSEQTNREAGLGNCGRRGAKGEAVPRPYTRSGRDILVANQAQRPAASIGFAGDLARAAR